MYMCTCMIAEPNICISPNIREYVTVSLGFVDVKIYLLDKIICKSMKLSVDLYRGRVCKNSMLSIFMKALAPCHFQLLSTVSREQDESQFLTYILWNSPHFFPCFNKGPLISFISSQRHISVWVFSKKYKIVFMLAFEDIKKIWVPKLIERLGLIQFCHSTIEESNHQPKPFRDTVPLASHTETQTHWPKPLSRAYRCVRY